ncbi:cell division protein FtsQ/DivIB [Acidovorax sp. Leaf160]|uniref:cell division protein FtsQ/DivIB n=1 Tax=Acidovorax sp. Leaf160 TaxID=1736280 RepID=UPI0009E661CE|nr:cell division protein FtsQ/DivIB [Acidovorax sp. Leaf160]
MNNALPAPFDVKLMNWTASALFVGCAALVLAAAGSWLLRLPVFSIGRIVVQGELVHNNPVTLRANVGPHLVGNFFTVDLQAVREAFEQVPWVRSAMVRREFPNSLRVELQEHQAAAVWGAEGGNKLVDSRGEVFEANSDDVEGDDLPRLVGPEGRSLEVLQMVRSLVPVLKPLGPEIDQLELTGRGGWRVTLEGGALIELGGGTPAQVLARAQRFVQTVPQVAAQQGRRIDALELADLRHDNGYALRLRGVSTVTAEMAAKPRPVRAPVRSGAAGARPATTVAPARTTGQTR